jgi:hypothetical protein
MTRTPKGLCSFPQCGWPMRAKGLCGTHWLQQRKGRTLTAVMRDRSVEDRFWAMVDRSAGRDGCWPWQGATDKRGYGVFNRGKQEIIKASRFSLTLKIGRELARDEVTRHKNECNNTSCCNPAHLEPGTQADNVADVIAAGHLVCGERSPHARLTEADVVRIRAEAAAVGRGYSPVLAAKYGVSARHLRKIVRGTRWAHAGGTR